MFARSSAALRIANGFDFHPFRGILTVGFSLGEPAGLFSCFCGESSGWLPWWPMDFEEFLRQVTPLLGLQARPLRRRGVRRRVERRLGEIGLSSLAAYLTRVKEEPAERTQLTALLTVTISRFFRDREVFDTLEGSVIPDLLRQKDSGEFKVWSVGCASGEEPYSFVLLWKVKFEKSRPGVSLLVLATDIDEAMLMRAKEGRYKKSSVREVPEGVVRDFFQLDGDQYTLNAAIRERVEFRRHDFLRDDPSADMDMIFCRNVAFTYFSKETQVKVLHKIFRSLGRTGYLVIGKDESLPLHFPTMFIPAFPGKGIYQRFEGCEKEENP